MSPKAFQYIPSASSCCNQRAYKKETEWEQGAQNQEIHVEQVKFEMSVRYVKGAVGYLHLEFRVEA